MATMKTGTRTCSCCGGKLPPADVWEANRDRAGECTGGIDPDTGRCYAYGDDDLWAMPEDDDQTETCCVCCEDFLLGNGDLRLVATDHGPDYVCNDCVYTSDEE